MRLLTIVSTRPDIIRLSKVIPKLDSVCENILVHTGQSFDDNMSDIFFRELNIRKPDYNLGIQGDFADQFGKLATGIRDVITKVKPDRMLVLGDTNSALSALVAKRMGVKVFHMESGNRCFSDLVPEEINRRVVDSCSDVLMPYTERARANLIREGYASDRIFVTGNPIWEVVKELKETNILRDLKLEPDQKYFKAINAISKVLDTDKYIKQYFLATVHRQENVDNPERLEKILMACGQLIRTHEIPVIFSLHPRTREQIGDIPLRFREIIFHEPFGLNDFITLEKNADCVLTDSGTVQEECCLFKVPCVTLRDVTERPETIECGSNILSGVEPDSILRCVKTALASEPNWNPPAEYLRTDVSDTVVKIVEGF